jgi:hypothetical protein
MVQLFEKKFQQAEASAQKGFKVDSTQIWIKKNLAHSLLYQSKYEEAKVLYLKYQDKPFPQDTTKTFGVVFLKDLDELEKAGITHPDVAKIRKLLSE